MKQQQPLILPQILFSGVVRKVHNATWEIPEDLLAEQFKKVSAILDQLEQDEGTLFCWFLIDNSLNKTDRIKMEKQLELLFEAHLSNEWDVEAILIPTTPNTSIEEIRTVVDRIVYKMFKRFPFEHFTQIVGFGDLIPFQAIFIEGLQQFGDRYASLKYEDNDILISKTSIPPNIPSWTREFRDLLMDHDYQTALELLRDLNPTKEILGIQNLLQMMIDRFNFAFADAAEHLSQAKEIFPNQPLLEATSDKLNLLLSDDERIRDRNRIIELYRQLDVYMDIDDTASFLTRFYRAREAVLYYLLHHAQTVQTPVRIGKKSTIYQVIDELERKYDNREIDGFYGAYFYLKSQNVARALNVRNQSFIGHARTGIDRKLLWHSYFGTSNTTIEKAKKRFRMDTTLLFRDMGIALDENIMDINRLLLELVSSILPLSQEDSYSPHLLSQDSAQHFPWILPEKSEQVPDVSKELLNDENIFSRDIFGHLHELVTSGNFTTAKKIFTLHKGKDQRISDLLDFGEHLKSLHFPNRNGAVDYFDLLIEVLAGINEQDDSDESQYVELMKNLRRKDQRAFIYYLHGYAEFLYSENDLIDFIVLFYRLCEETLLYSLGWDINWNIQEERRQFFIRKDAKHFLPIPKTERISKHFHRYMKMLKQEIRTIEVREQVKIRRDKSVGLEQLSERDQYFAELYLFFNQKEFEEFLDLRHEGVSGHGFADFTIEDFEQMLGGISPLAYLEKHLDSMGILPELSIFKLIQKGILGIIDFEQAISEKGPISSLT